jgi:hypothetical protein
LQQQQEEEEEEQEQEQEQMATQQAEEDHHDQERFPSKAKQKCGGASAWRRPCSRDITIGLWGVS